MSRIEFLVIKVPENAGKGLMCHKNTHVGGLDSVSLKHPQSSTNVSETPNAQEKVTLTVA